MMCDSPREEETQTVEYFRVNTLTAAQKLDLASSGQASADQLHILASPENPVEVLVAVAGNENTAVRTLQKLFRVGYDNVYVRLSQNPNLPEETLLQIFGKWLAEKNAGKATAVIKLFTAVQHPNFPQRKVLEMLDGDDLALREIVCKTSKLSEMDMYRVASTETNVDVLCALASNSIISTNTIDALVSRNLSPVSAVVAERSNVTSSQATRILVYTQDEDYVAALACLASNKNLTMEQYLVIFEQGNGYVHYRLARNPKIPSFILQMIASNSNHPWQEIAKEALDGS